VVSSWLASKARIALAAALLAGCASAPPAPPGAETREAVVLLHGYGRSDRAMRSLARRLGEAGYLVHNLHYRSTERDPDALVADLDAMLSACCADAPRVHFVTHSLGGVLVRAYLAAHRSVHLGRVVMLAPPNRGSELGDVVARWRILRALLGPTAAALGTTVTSLPNRLPGADFELGVVAGTRSWNPLGSWLIPDADDGTVSVASTRLDGMADFIALPVSHTFIVRSREAAAQVDHFLRYGRFDHGAEAGAAAAAGSAPEVGSGG
jgi:pimeloyl-ACP methyl ester carboxylesterase